MPKTKSFSCAQFDKVADRMNVKLREEKRYLFRSGGPLARFDGDSVVFDELRFLLLSSRGRCSLLAHELEHSRDMEFAMSATTSFVWLVVTLTASVYVVTLLVRAGLLTWALAAPAIIVLVLIGILVGLDLRRRVLWKAELNCDSAAAMLLGTDAVKEWLAIVAEPRWGRFSSHPPNAFRLRSVEATAMGSAPEIDFDLLEREEPHLIVMDGQPEAGPTRPAIPTKAQ
jgi:hypothetical protein